MSEQSLKEEEGSPFLPHTAHDKSRSTSPSDRPAHPGNQSPPMPTRKLVRLVKVCATVAVLAVVLFVVFALVSPRPVSHMIISQFSDHKAELGLKNIYVNKVRNLVFTNRHDPSRGVFLSISFPYSLKSQSGDPQNKKCQFSNFSMTPKIAANDIHVLYTHQQSCFEFDNQMRAAVYETDVLRGAECYVVHWFSQRENSSIENCIDMSSDNWYGGGTLAVHRWPLNRANVAMQPFITKNFEKTLLALSESGKYNNHFSSFLEPYFLSAAGVAILLDHKLPLFVSVNENGNKKICFKSSFEKPFDAVHSLQQGGIHLNYTVCKDMSARAMHEQVLAFGSVQHPKEVPRIELLKKPVWGTRGQDIVNETKLLSFVKNIKGFSLNFSQLFIDGNYTKLPGGIFFDEKRFPHSAQIIMELDEMLPEKNLKVGTEVHPVIPDYVTDKNDLSFPHSDTEQLDYDRDPFLLNVLNEAARRWFKSQLDDVHQQLHVNGFRFSGGDTANFLKHGDIKASAFNFSINELTTKYASLAAIFRDSSFMGSGYKSQVHGLISDAGPFISTWDHCKGLKAVIPTAITLGLMGYPFVSAGPIGGINLDKVTGQLVLPMVDLYIRWLQISIFLPVVEFSIGPWEYGPKVVKYAQVLLAYRQKILWPQYLSAAVKEAVDVGTPIIRPLWWIAADDPKAQFIDCEFLVSNSLLVAPVLVRDQTARDIYLPNGSWWKDVLRGNVYEGGQWLRRYTVGQFEIATFVQKAAPKLKAIG